MLKRWQVDFHLCCGRGERCAVPDKSMQKPRGAGAGRPVPSSSSAHACVSPLAGLAGSVRATSPLHRYAMQTHVNSTKTAVSIAVKTILRARREVTRTTESRRRRVPLAGKRGFCTRVLRTKDARRSLDDRFD